RHTSFSRDWSSDVCSSDLRLVLCDSFKNAHLDTGLIQREEAFLLPPSAEIDAELVISAALIELLSRQAQNPLPNNPVWQHSSFRSEERRVGEGGRTTRAQS